MWKRWWYGGNATSSTDGLKPQNFGFWTDGFPITEIWWINRARVWYGRAIPRKLYIYCLKIKTVPSSNSSSSSLSLACPGIAGMADYFLPPCCLVCDNSTKNLQLSCPLPTSVHRTFGLPLLLFPGSTLFTVCSSPLRIAVVARLFSWTFALRLLSLWWYMFVSDPILLCPVAHPPLHPHLVYF